jgi:hypothetical protein
MVKVQGSAHAGRLANEVAGVTEVRSILLTLQFLPVCLIAFVVSGLSGLLGSLVYQNIPETGCFLPFDIRILLFDFLRT